MPVEREREGRINLRVDPNQEARLRAAAEANGESLAEFLLAAGAEQAEAVLEGTTRIALSATAFEQFINALGAKTRADVKPQAVRLGARSDSRPVTAAYLRPVENLGRADLTARRRTAVCPGPITGWGAVE